MKVPAKQDKNGISVFTEEDFFRDGESVFIHLSTDYSDYEDRLHKHEFAEISYILSGEAEHEVGGIRYRVGRGDVIAIKPDTVHTFHPIGRDEPFVAYDLMFSERFLGMRPNESSELSDMCTELFCSGDDSSPDLHLDSSSYAAVGDLFHRIYLEYHARERGSLDIIRAYVTELIVKLFRKLESESQDRLSARQRAAVRECVCYLEENFKSHITLDELASRMYFSKDYLNRIFRKIMGVPVGAYLQRLRLDEACRLLRSTDKTVAEIAEYSGYGDTKTFSTVFKREMKITPGEYRSE